MNHRGRVFRFFLASTLSAIAVVAWFNISATTTSSQPESTTISSVIITTQVPKHAELSYAQWDPVTASDSKNVEQARNVLTVELAKYPTGRLANAGLERIYLVKNLRWGGLTQSAMPEAFIDLALYLSIDTEYLQSENGVYYRHLIHHEAQHLFDAHTYNTYRYNDTAWLSCNPGGFTYSGSGLAFNKTDQNTRIEHPSTGFVTSYSVSAIEEDKAEVHAYLMTKPATINSYASQDQNLKCKEQLAQDFISKL